MERVPVSHHKDLQEGFGIVNPDSMFTSSMERIMSAANQDHQTLVKNLEINTSYELIRSFADMWTKDEDFAKSVAEQICDNALVRLVLCCNRKGYSNWNNLLL